jgi:hypothetical protein
LGSQGDVATSTLEMNFISENDTSSDEDEQAGASKL